jgi:hypothetical protein
MAPYHSTTTHPSIEALMGYNIYIYNQQSLTDRETESYVNVFGIPGCGFAPAT